MNQEHVNGVIDKKSHRHSDLFNLYFHLHNTFFTGMLRRSFPRRVVLKNGKCNISYTNLAKKRHRYLVDIFTTLVDIQWRYNILVFVASFVLSWLVFAVLWWSIAFVHGDFDHMDDPKWRPCVEDMTSFISAFLFSIETQHTIGYGMLYITTACPVADALFCVQCLVGVLIQALMVGVVYAKMIRPKNRSHTLMFSHHAVVSLRDGKLCLMFRIADMRKSHIILAQVHAQLIKKRITSEGEELINHIYDINLKVDTCGNHMLFIWPSTVVHVIDEKSPFYCMSANDLLHEEFEIVVNLEGVIETTGVTTQARSSYLPNEILWGRRFRHIVSYDKETEEYKVDYNGINHTTHVSTPLCSAKQLIELRRDSSVSCSQKRLLLPSTRKATSSSCSMPRNSSFESIKSIDSISEHSKSKVTAVNTVTVWCIS